jgi:hypothetical protein
MMERVADNEERSPESTEPRTPPAGQPAPDGEPPVRAPNEPTPGGELVRPPEHPPGGELSVRPPEHPPGGELSVRPPSEPAAPPVPPAIGADEVREFQEFQQFRELMRQQREQGFPQGAPPPPGSLQPWGPPQQWGPPPKRDPLWRRALRPIAGKVISLAVVAAMLALGALWLLEQLPGSGPPERGGGPPHVAGGKKAETNLIFETDPRNAVQKIYDDIAQDDPTSACGRFTDEARAEFAEHFANLGASCEEVVGALTAQVESGQKSEYANPRFPPWVNTNPTSDTVPVSSCALEVTGGPRLGLLTVSKIENSVGGQWIVTRHDDEPADCSGVATGPPTT